VRKSIRIVLLASLSVLIVLVTGILWLLYGDCTGLPKRLYHRVVLGEDFVSKDVRFRFYMAGNGHTPKGHTFDFTTVRASDCVEVTSRTENEGTAAEAEKEMEKMVRNASRVIERGPEVDQNGQPVGKRTVLLFENRDKRAIVVWTRGMSQLFTIESASLSHALEYEKRITKAHRYDGRGYLIDLTGQ
jgi:hypothetical protein